MWDTGITDLEDGNILKQLTDQLLKLKDFENKDIREFIKKINF